MITFFFTFKGIGGVQVLIYNLMKELYKDNIRTKLIYHQDSWLTRELDKSDVGYDFFDLRYIKTKSLNQFIKHEDILCTPMLFMELVHFSKINPSILLWNVSPFTFDYNMNNCIYFRRLTRTILLRKMLNKNSLVFMDYLGVKSVQKQFGLDINPSFIPIPIFVASKNEFKEREVKKWFRAINITYVGRSLDWKVYPIIKVISDISKFDYEELKVVLHIITDDTESFRKFIGSYSSHLEIKFHSELGGEELRMFLSSNSDLHIGMGTSCLEGSALGIPTILIDTSYKEFPQHYRYRWVFESDSFNLGELFDEFPPVFNGRQFSEILELYLKEDSKELQSISENCYEYTKQYHDIHKVGQDFTNQCAKSCMRIRDVLYTDLSYYLKEILIHTCKSRITPY